MNSDAAQRAIITSRKRQELKQPAVIGVAGKDPPKRQVGSNSAAYEIGLSNPICAAKQPSRAERS